MPKIFLETFKDLREALEIVIMVEIIKLINHVLQWIIIGRDNKHMSKDIILMDITKPILTLKAILSCYQIKTIAHTSPVNLITNNISKEIIKKKDGNILKQFANISLS